jgi:hypothetical protein
LGRALGFCQKASQLISIPTPGQNWNGQCFGLPLAKHLSFDLLDLAASFIINQKFGSDAMSGLKSAWEISLEKSDKLVPGGKKRKKLTARQKERIAEIRKEYKAKIADKDITHQHKLNRLEERTPPELLLSESEKLKQEFAEDKERLEKEMEAEVEAVREPSK